MTLSIRPAFALLGLVAITGAARAAEVEAGSLFFARPPASATSADGAVRPLAERGDPVFAGDVLETAAGIAQFRLSDGTTLSMSPNSRYRIDEYRFAGDDRDRGFFSLLRGRIRTVLGRIGERVAQQYRLDTEEAHLGRRGTTFRAERCAAACPSGVGLYVRTEEGVVSLTNDAGSIEVQAGEVGYVRDRATLPVVLEEGAGAPQPVVPAVPEPQNIYETPERRLGF